MPDRPPEMYQGDRQVEPEFDAGEWFYYRVDPAFCRSDWSLEPVQIKLSVRCPDLSSNRQRFSKPWYVLYPRLKFERWAVYRFQQHRLPRTVQSNQPQINQPRGNAPAIYEIRTEHDPQGDNYGHCETRFYRGSERVTNGINPNAKNIFRLDFARVALLERRPGEPYPPPSHSA